MADSFVIANMQAALAERIRPTVTIWNRLEGRPRTADFQRALRAEVRDALWMLTRQWQMGEFKGEDAGSPVTAKLHLHATQLTVFQPHDQTPMPLPPTVPLESTVEQRPVPLTLDIRAMMGRQWLKMVSPIGSYADAFRNRFRFTRPGPSDRADAARVAHVESWQAFAAAAGRLMDGGALYEWLVSDGTHRAYDGVSGVADVDKPALDTQAEAFRRWFEALFLNVPSQTPTSWDDSRLEYRFKVSAPLEPAGQKVLTADEYHGGRLDWYAFDIDPTTNTLGNVEGAPAGAHPNAVTTQGLVPVPVTFDGMPNTRWWTFEDGRTNFGDIKPETTDLAKLLLMEFGLVYANDWFVIPCTLPMGTFATVRGLAVTNVFGERFWIRAAGRGVDDDWQRWSMFNLNVKGRHNEPADSSILLLPTTAQMLENEAVEDVALVRDEMANMVWAIEKKILLPHGWTRSGGGVATETRSFHERMVAAQSGSLPPVEWKAPIRYEVMNSVPENWIPFIPTHRGDGNVREIQLQRAAMPRLIANDTESIQKVRPRTQVIRPGLDSTPMRSYFIHEEEVTRAGIRVSHSFQRTRWLGGRTALWLGVRKQTGRGEGSSGLAFDRIVPTRS